MAGVSEHVREELDRSRLTLLIGKDSYYITVLDVLKAFQPEAGMKK